MNILITGANGFIGKNLVAELSSSRPDYTLLSYDMDTDPALLDDFCREANFVFHLAGVNRPKEQSEFMEVISDSLLSFWIVLRNIITVVQ